MRKNKKNSINKTKANSKSQKEKRDREKEFKRRAQIEFKRLMLESTSNLADYEEDLIKFFTDQIDTLYHKRAVSLKRCKDAESKQDILEEIFNLEQQIIKSYCCHLQKFHQVFLKGIKQTRLAMLSILFINCHYQTEAWKEAKKMNQEQFQRHQHPRGAVYQKKRKEFELYQNYEQFQQAKEEEDNKNWQDQEEQKTHSHIKLQDFLYQIGMTQDKQIGQKFKDGFVKNPQNKLIDRYEVDFVPFVEMNLFIHSLDEFKNSLSLILESSRQFYLEKYEKFIDTKQFARIYEVLNDFNELEENMKQWTTEAYQIHLQRQNKRRSDLFDPQVQEAISLIQKDIHHYNLNDLRSNPFRTINEPDAFDIKEMDESEKEQ